MSTLNGRGLGTVTAKTANYTVTTADNGTTFTNEGAAGAITFAMPAATVGLRYRFHVLTAQELRIDPNGTETTNMAVGGAQQAAGAYITANADLEFIELHCVKAGRWETVAVAGTWTAV
jgi:hypothetical protein